MTRPYRLAWRILDFNSALHDDPRPATMQSVSNLT
jgi:hypothetical protein